LLYIWTIVEQASTEYEAIASSGNQLLEVTGIAAAVDGDSKRARNRAPQVDNISNAFIGAFKEILTTESRIDRASIGLLVTWLISDMK